MKFLISIVAVLVVATGVVHAQPADSDAGPKVTLARRLYDEGVDAIGNRQWSLAYDRFKASYELAPRILTLYNLAGAQGQTGRLVEATENYRRFLRDTGDGRYPELQTEATHQLELLGRQIAQLTVKITNLEPTDVVVIDDLEFPQAALHEAIPLNPGAHTARIQRGTDLLATRAITLSSGAAETVHIELPIRPPDLVVHKIPEPPGMTAPASPAAPPKPADRGPSRTWIRSPWLWSGVAAVVVGATASAYLLTRSPDGLHVN